MILRTTFLTDPDNPMMSPKQYVEIKLQARGLQLEVIEMSKPTFESDMLCWDITLGGSPWELMKFLYPDTEYYNETAQLVKLRGASGLDILMIWQNTSTTNRESVNEAIEEVTNAVRAALEHLEC